MKNIFLCSSVSKFYLCLAQSFAQKSLNAIWDKTFRFECEYRSWREMKLREQKKKGKIRGVWCEYTVIVKILKIDEKMV